MAELNQANFAPQVPGPGLPTGLQQQQQGSVPQQQSGGDGLVGLISLVSLLEGNPGPFFQLQEQRRKTQVFRQLTPILTKTSQLSNEGKYDEALDLANQAFATLGDRSPEIGQFLNQLTTKLSDKHNAVVQLQTTAKYYDKIFPKDHPSRPKVDAIVELAKDKTPAAAQTLQTIMSQLKPEVQQLEGKTTITDPQTGKQLVIPQKVILRLSDMPPFVQRSLEEKYGAPIQELTNIYNKAEGYTIRSEAGVDITDDIKQNMSADIAKFATTMKEIEIAKLSPTTSEYNEAMLEHLTQQGLTGEEARMRMARGQLNNNDHKAARQSTLRFAVMKAEAPVIAAIGLDPARVEASGYVYVNNDYNSPRFGNAEAVSFRQGESNPSLSAIRTKYHDQVLNAKSIVQGFDYINLMFDELGNPDTPASRLSAGLKQYVTGITGFDFTDPKNANITVSKAAQAIVDRQIERLLDTATIPSTKAAELKALTIGKFADSQAARQAVEVLKNRSIQELSLYIQGKNTPATKLPKEIRSEQTLQRTKSIPQLGVDVEFAPGGTK